MENRFFDVGRIGKARGLKGLVKVIPAGPAEEDALTEGHLLYIRNERGDWVPLRIESVHTEVKKQRTLFFVKFDRIATREDAEALMDHGLYTDQKLEPAEMEEEPSLIGYSVWTHTPDTPDTSDSSEDSAIGIVQDLLGSSMQQVLVVQLHPFMDGDQTEEIQPEILLIPLVDEYVEEIDHQTETILCKNLDQLEEE